MGGGASTACWASLGYEPAQRWRVDRRWFVAQRLLGEGGFSFVHLVKDEQSGAEYALKCITVQSGRALEEANNEVMVMLSLQHPSLLPCLASATVETQGGLAATDDGGGLPLKHVLLLLPAYAEGTLQNACDAVLPQGFRLPAVTVLHICAQVAEALQAMHEHTPPYAHRDVKPANVLLSGGWRALLQGEPPTAVAENVRAVLSDFGSTRPVLPTSPTPDAAASRRAMRAAAEAAGAESTAHYRAPELFDCADSSAAAAVNEKVDIWALGCLLYAAMYGSAPFEAAVASGGSLPLAVLSGRVRFPSERPFPAAMHEAVLACLAKAPQDRPRAGEVGAKLRELARQV